MVPTLQLANDLISNDELKRVIVIALIMVEILLLVVPQGINDHFTWASILYNKLGVILK